MFSRINRKPGEGWGRFIRRMNNTRPCMYVIMFQAKAGRQRGNSRGLSEHGLYSYYGQLKIKDWKLKIRN